MAFKHALPAEQALPSQPRSQAALSRFIEAGAEALAADVFEHTGIAALAQKAGSSVGTFYRIVGDKEHLLRLVHAGFIARSTQVLERALDADACAACSASERLQRFIDALIEIYRGQEGLLRALIRRSSSDLPFRRRFHELNDAVSQRLANALAPRADAAQAMFAAHALLGIMNHYTVTGSLGPISPDALARELHELVGRYLGL